MTAYGVSDVGRRDNNEDSFLVSDQLGLYLVADGMGGYEGGEVASKVVVDTLQGAFDPSPVGDEAQSQMLSAIRKAHQAVVNRAKGQLKEMGSTLAALYVDGDYALIAHVGDSRVYRLRDKHLTRLTRDHSYVEELKQSGRANLIPNIPPQYHAMITRSISMGADANPDLRVERANSGDVFMLCSDGITDVIDDHEIKEILIRFEDDPKAASDALLEVAYAKGSTDNLTAVVVRA